MSAQPHGMPNAILPAGAWQRRRITLMNRAGAASLSRQLADARTLPLAYVRSGPRTPRPVLVIPGGPGLGSILPYQRFRANAARQGLDLIMVEHRGVGASRKTAEGADLRPADITVPDIVSDLGAVLEAQAIDQVIVYGSSYGSYLAAAFATRYPERVGAMILDSPMLGAHSTSDAAVALNQAYWHGTGPTAELAARVQALAQHGVVTVDQAGVVLQLLHESGGNGLVATMLDLLERGKGTRAWAWLFRLATADVMRIRPFLMEFDLVARCAFSELGYGIPHDPVIGPLSSDASYARLAERFPRFEGNPVDVSTALAHFDWPLLVLSGDRDLRTPRKVAEHVVANAPRATLVPIEQHGHSALDNAAAIALEVIQRLSISSGGAGNVLNGLRASRSMAARLIETRLALAGLLPRPAS